MKAGLVSVLVADHAGLEQHAQDALPFLSPDARAALTARLLPFWEKEVARRTAPTYYLPTQGEDFVRLLEAIHLGTDENIIVLTTQHNLAPVTTVLDVYTPSPDLFGVERWTPAAAKRVCGMDPRWYQEYVELQSIAKFMSASDMKRQAQRNYKRTGSRWEFLGNLRSQQFDISSLAPRTPGRLLNVEGAVYTTILTVDELDELVDIIWRAGAFAFDTETTGLHPIDADLVGISIACDEGRAYYIPVGHDEGEQLPMSLVMDKLAPVFEAEGVKKYGHKIAFDVNFIEAHSDVRVQGIAGDSKTLAWMLGQGSSGARHSFDQTGLKQLASSRLNIKMMDFATTISGKDNAAGVPIDRMTSYASADADMTLRLVRRLIHDLTERERARYYEIELPFLRTVSNIERRGAFVNVEKVRQLDQEYQRERLMVSETLKGITRKEDFNPRSPQQVGKYLFKELGLPPVGGRTKTGFKVDQKTLEKLKGMHPVVELLLEFTSISTLISRYTSALPYMVSPVTGRVHSLLSATGTATGRISSSDPNLMNIPVRTERGAKMRYVIEGQDDNEILDIDYSQIEPRVMAHMSEDRFLIETFERGIDLYRSIGGRFFDCPPDDVEKKQRDAMKMAWLALTYLVGPKKLSEQLSVVLGKHVSVQEASDFLKDCYTIVPGVRAFQQSQIEFADKHGYVETLMGFRIPVPGIRSPIPEQKAHAHSQAVNLPVQGTASGDIVKLAMNQLDLLSDTIPMMFLQIHDELLFEGPREMLEDMAPVISTIMENIYTLRVPLIAEPSIAKTWGDAKGQ